MSVPQEHIIYKLGDTIIVPLMITDSDGGPMDLTDATLTGRIWVEGATTDTIASLSVTPATPLTSGIVNLLLSPATVPGLEARGPHYWFDIQIINGATILEGRFYVEPDRIR